MLMKKYRKRPIEIDACQIAPANIGLLAIEAGITRDEENGDTVLLIHTLEGIMRAGYGDWLVRGIEGEYYPVKDSIFRSSYEPVEEAEGG
jgi:hypothetical protein